MPQHLPWMAILIASVFALGSEASAQHADIVNAAVAADENASIAETAVAQPALQRESQSILRRKSNEDASALVNPAQDYGGWSAARTLGALAGVVALIVFLAWGYKAMAGGNLALLGRARRPGLIELVSRTSISARQSLCLVRLGPRMVLIGQSADNLQALDVIDDPDVVARLSGEALKNAAPAAAKDEDREFQACLDREALDYLGQDTNEEAEVDETFTPEHRRVDDVRRSLSETIQRVRRAITPA